jgi:hypothetical protein
VVFTAILCSSFKELEFAVDLVREEDAYTFIGLYESGDDESGVWRWVDGSDAPIDGWEPVSTA